MGRERKREESGKKVGDASWSSFSACQITEACFTSFPRERDNSIELLSHELKLQREERDGRKESSSTSLFFGSDLKGEEAKVKQ